MCCDRPRPRGRPRARRDRVAALVTALLGLALAAPGVASASNTWRCGNRLVHIGAARGEVTQICGAPTERKSSVEYTSVRLRSGEEILQAVFVEVWIYNRGPRQFIRYLTFHDGRLDDVSEGGYGY